MEHELASSKRQLAIIMPSFRDVRILEAIASVRAFDDVGAVKLVIIDGGSSPDLVAKIVDALTPDDLLVTEPDKGIFDALNKGLGRVEAKYVGWLGSDDMFSGEVRASEVLAALADADLFMTALAFVNEKRVERITHPWPAAVGLSEWGLHNPHYATFGRHQLLASELFVVDDIAADIDYFLRIFAKAPRVIWTGKIGTLQGSGGFSNSSIHKILKVNGSVLDAYRRRGGPLRASLAIAVKLGYKTLGRAYFRLRRTNWRDRFTVAADTQRAVRLAENRLEVRQQ